MHSFIVFWVNPVCERLLALVIVFFCTGKRMKRFCFPKTNHNASSESHIHICSLSFQPKITSACSGVCILKHICVILSSLISSIYE